LGRSGDGGDPGEAGRGSNSLRFLNSTANAPDLDSITLS
jgi:hypothetical protein